MLDIVMLEKMPISALHAMVYHKPVHQITEVITASHGLQK